jgi:hypothetical protein
MKIADRSHNVSLYSHLFLKYLKNAGMLSGLRQSVFDFIPRKEGPELGSKLQFRHINLIKYMRLVIKAVEQQVSFGFS